MGLSFTPRASLVAWAYHKPPVVPSIGYPATCVFVQGLLARVTGGETLANTMNKKAYNGIYLLENHGLSSNRFRRSAALSKRRKGARGGAIGSGMRSPAVVRGIPRPAAPLYLVFWVVFA